MPFATLDLWPEIVRGINQTRVATHHSPVVWQLGRDVNRTRPFRVGPHLGDTDGVIVFAVDPTTELSDWLNRLSAPSVLLDTQHPSVSSVFVDHEASAARATRHLLAIGHERIAVVDYADDRFRQNGGARARRRGYRSALARAGVAPHVGYERVGDGSVKAGRAAAERWLALPDAPTAVFAGSDRQALGVLEAARERGIRVPEDLAVVGYGDIGLAAYLGLTTTRVPLLEMGQRAVQVLLDAVADSSSEPVHIHLPTELVIRRSCGAR